MQVATQIQGTLSGIFIETEFGPISGLVELLSAKRDGTVFMQPFRFLALDDGEAERLKQLLKRSRPKHHNRRVALNPNFYRAYAAGAEHLSGSIEDRNGGEHPRS